MTTLLDDFPYNLIQDHFQWMSQTANTDTLLLELNELLIDHAYHLVEGPQLAQLEQSVLESIAGYDETLRSSIYYAIAKATHELRTPEDDAFLDDDETEGAMAVDAQDLALAALWQSGLDDALDGAAWPIGRYRCRIQGIVLGTGALQEAERSREPGAPLRAALTQAGLIGERTQLVVAPHLVEFSQALSWFEAHPFAFTRIAQRALAAAPSGRFPRHDIWHGLPQAPAATGEDGASLMLLFALVDEAASDAPTCGPIANTRLITSWPAMLRTYARASPTLRGALEWASLPMAPADLMYSQNGLI